MNIYFKYLPLLYTYNTRLNSISNLLYFFLYLLLYPIVSLYVFLFLISSEELFSVDMFFWVLLFYLVFIIFYEIWYIVNDLITVKFEKKPTLRIKEKINNIFIFFNIFIRLIIVGILLLYINNIWFDVIIFFIGFLFIIHNFFRNIVINSITYFFLRFMKYIIVFSVIDMHLIFNNIYQFLILILLFFLYHYYYQLQYFLKKMKKDINKDIHNGEILSKIYLFNLIFYLFVVLILSIFNIKYILIIIPIVPSLINMTIKNILLSKKDKNEKIHI